MMNRMQSLLALGSSAIVAPNSNRPATPHASEFRWLVPVLEYRVGILADVGAMSIARERATHGVLLNIPRASRNDSEWRTAKPPDTPYYTQSQRITDVITYGGPDVITVGAVVGFQAVFGVEVPGAAAPNYLVRVTPRTLEMQAFALPDDGHGTALALYKTGQRLTVVRQDGSLLRIDY